MENNYQAEQMWGVCVLVEDSKTIPSSGILCCARVPSLFCNIDKVNVAMN